MERSKADLYVFKMLPPELLDKVRNYAVKLLVAENQKNAAKKEVADDAKRS
jgi:hypothetical protein